jgi:hypothetical protein
VTAATFSCGTINASQTITANGNISTPVVNTSTLNGSSIYLGDQTKTYFDSSTSGTTYNTLYLGTPNCGFYQTTCPAYCIQPAPVLGNSINTSSFGSDLILKGGNMTSQGNNGSVNENPNGGNVRLVPGQGYSTAFGNRGAGNIIFHGYCFPNLDSIYSNGTPGNRWYSVYSTNGVITTSDETLKDIVPLKYGLDEIMKVSTIQYKWKTQQDLPDTDPHKNDEYYGLKAQELDNIFPELVYKSEGSNLQLNYSEMIPVLINAIQTLNNKINGLISSNA